VIQFSYEWTKEQLFDYTLRFLKQRLRPQLEEWPEVVGRTVSQHRYGSGGRYYGDYDGSVVTVNVAASTYPPRKRGRVWSFPGHKSDRTAAGILAHEFGHVIWKERVGRTAAREWARSYCDRKRAITGYEPTPEEAFAETARLFLLNPKLLYEGRRARFYFLRQTLGLEPLHKKSWEDVLLHAPEFIVQAAGKFAFGKR
jgi:hypothetical protein